MEKSVAKQLKELENARLKKLLAELSMLRSST